MTWGEQTDVPESADWYNAGYLMLWGSNVPQTRTPDAHFYTEVRYKGTKSVVDLARLCARRPSSPISGCTPSRAPTRRWRWRMGHVILREFHLDRQRRLFRRTTRAASPTCRCWSAWCARAAPTCPSDCCAPRISTDNLGEANNAAWKTMAFDAGRSIRVVPHGSIGFRWGEQGKWNLRSERDERRPRGDAGADAGRRQSTTRRRRLPVFRRHRHQRHFTATDHPDVLVAQRAGPQRWQLRDGDTLVTTVFDLICANYGLDRGFGGDQCRDQL